METKLEVPINLCLLYLSYLPLQFKNPCIKSEYEYKYFYDYIEPPKGKYISINSLSNHFWFTIENWMSRKYHTLILYPFSSADMSHSFVTIFFTLHIIPSTGISSFWFAYFCGSIGGGFGKVIEYYYGYYRLCKNRRRRKEKYKFEDIASKQMEFVMNDIDYNPHDYIDDKLLQKLYYTSNAKQAYIGPQLAIYGLMGYSFSLSAHYLYKKLKTFLKHKIDDIDSIERIETMDDSMYSNIHKKQQRNYKYIAMNIYHSIVFGFTFWNIYSHTMSYIKQMKQKQNDRGGYGFMASGTGIYGVDLGTLTSFWSGIIAYPIVLNVQKIYKTDSNK